jgi:hypothetical protein
MLPYVKKQLINCINQINTAMSHIYKIATKERIHVEDLLEQLRSKRILACYKGESPTYLIFEDGYSTRGVEITEEKYGYEIRMMVLASANDYLLCNEIVFIICDSLKGILTDEDGKERYIGKLFYDLNISQKMKSDIEATFALLKHGENIDIPGPVREFSFGPITRQKALALTGDQHAVAYKLSKMIQACQYPPENFIPFSNLIRVKDKDGSEYFIQVLTNSKDTVVEKVKLYGVPSGTGESYFLKIDQLISIMPDEWVLVDDFTILAKQLEDKNWRTFVEQAKEISKDV